MTDEPQIGGPDALTQAQQTIAQQSEEITRLLGQLADNHFANQLREVFSLAVTAGTVAAPLSQEGLLNMVVDTAAYVLEARAASLFLVDEQTGELAVACAIGPKAEEMRMVRLPIGHGIAGLVAVSREPMAIADAQSDPRQAADIAQRVGYMPESILCVPLIYADQVIGVLELLDKEDATSFSTTDIEVLGRFAEQAAIAIEQSRTLQDLTALIGRVLNLLPETADEQMQQLQRGARDFAARIEQDPTYRGALELARLSREIASRGESELNVCRTILRGFVDYLRSRPEPFGELWGRL